MKKNEAVITDLNNGTPVIYPNHTYSKNRRYQKLSLTQKAMLVALGAALSYGVVYITMLIGWLVWINQI